MTVYRTSRITPKRWAFTLCLAIAMAMLLTETLLEKYTLEAERQQKQLIAAQQLGRLSAGLGALISNNLSLLSGLAAHIGVSPNITQQEFAAYASTIFRQEALLVNVAAAPDLVIRFVYPLDENNKNALGIDYRQLPDQLPAVQALDRRGAMILAGPVQLVQGGEAIIGRAAVFTENDQLWGIVSAPIYTQDLYAKAGLLNESLPIEIAIRGIDASGSKGQVFFGNADIFNDPFSITSELAIVGGSWLMAARPVKGWKETSGTFIALRISILIIGLILMFLVLYRYQQVRREQEFRLALEKNRALLEEVGKLALIGGWQVTPTDNNLLLSLWNQQSSTILGLNKENPSLEDILEIFGSAQADYLKASLVNATLGTSFDTELQFTSQGTETRWVRFKGKPVSDQNFPSAVLGSIQDITERKRFTNKIQHQAIYDQLTGLPNRLLFYNRLSKAIRLCQREGSQLAVLFIDLDNFKPVNDNLGHGIGDALLTNVGQRIKSCIRSTDTVARYSGDEFIVVLLDVRDNKVPVNIAQEIIAELNKPFVIDDNTIYCGASIGISLYPNDGGDVEALVSKADQAMYEVKRSGRNGWQFFTKAMQVVSEKRHSLSNQLVAAIKNEELSVSYQPIIDLMDNRIHKCEALVRWQHQGQMIPTDEFINLAEETGRINEIDRFVLRKASMFLIGLVRKTGNPIALSINVSPRVFSSKDNSLELWLDLIMDAAKHIDITVEMTERLLIEESDRIMWVLTKLKSKGVTIAIDDFGTGYSSLSYLTKFPIDIIKIDKSFVKKLGVDKIPEALTKTVINLAHSLNLEVVAEGVETEPQMAMLKNWHCDFGQGYLFDKPLTEGDFAERIASQAKRNRII